MFGADFYPVLLGKLHRGLRPLGTREHMQIADLLRSPAQANREELAAALASLLARDQDEWERVARMVRETYAIRLPARSGDVLDTVALGGPAESPLPRGRGEPKKPAQSKVRADRIRQYVAAGLLGLLVLGGSGVGAYYLLKPPKLPPPTPPIVETASPAQPQQVKKQPDFVIEQLEAAWEKQRQLPGQPVAVLRDWWPVCAAGVLAWLLGLRLLLLPGSIVESRRRRAEQMRDRWHQAQLESGAPPMLPYRVTVDPPLPAQAIEDAAQYLGRLHQREGRGGLDVPATIDRTIDEGGRLSPIWEVPRRPQELLVLIDEEGGDSPYLGGFRRICDRWRRLGVGLTLLRLPRSAEALEELGRHHGGAALLVFSRQLSMHGLQGQAPLLGAVEAFWPRAWLDPDPRTDAEREDVERRHGREIARKLQRFPLSRRGLVLLARHLGGEVLPGMPEWEPLLPLSAVEGAIRRWAQLAALVPDPTWDQLEWLRQQMPSLKRLDRAAYVHRLLEWLMRRGQRDPERGARLGMEAALEMDLRGELRQEEGQRARAGVEELEVRRELLRQLEGAAPRDELLQELLRVKRAIHGAAFAPEQADELLLPVADSPLCELVEHELEQVEAPLTRQVLGGAAVSLRDLVGAPARWSRSALAVAAVTGLLLVIGGLVPWAPWRWLRRPGAVDTQVFASVDKVIRVERVQPKPEQPTPPPLPPKETTWPETWYRAKMVRIKAGSFIMGSPNDEVGRSDDEVQHQVQITRDFALAMTEVTQGQYQRVMGGNPSNFKGDSLPVEQVEWFDAVQYCNKLSAQEKLEECYAIQGEQVKWKKGLDCQGFRLPTEAEWEYAARAGGRTLYSGSNTLKWVAWFAGNSENKTQPVGKLKANSWGLKDMSGNVWEWVWDRDGPYEGKVDPQGPPSGSRRVVRGGSWYNAAPRPLRVAYRFRSPPGDRYYFIGFRLSRSLP